MYYFLLCYFIGTIILIFVHNWKTITPHAATEVVKIMLSSISDDTDKIESFVKKPFVKKNITGYIILFLANRICYSGYYFEHNNFLFEDISKVLEKFGYQGSKLDEEIYYITLCESVLQATHSRYQKHSAEFLDMYQEERFSFKQYADHIDQQHFFRAAYGLARLKKPTFISKGG